MILQATHTHLYPGHRGRISGPAQIGGLQAEQNCLVEFADGSAAAGRITKPGDDWQLDTDPYRTAAGTTIAAKRWIIGLQQHDGHVEFRILKKA